MSVLYGQSGRQNVEMGKALTRRYRGAALVPPFPVQLQLRKRHRHVRFQVTHPRRVFRGSFGGNSGGFQNRVAKGVEIKGGLLRGYRPDFGVVEQTRGGDCFGEGTTRDGKRRF